MKFGGENIMFDSLPQKADIKQGIPPCGFVCTSRKHTSVSLLPWLIMKVLWLQDWLIDRESTTFKYQLIIPLWWNILRVAIGDLMVMEVVLFHIAWKFWKSSLFLISDDVIRGCIRPAFYYQYILDPNTGWKAMNFAIKASFECSMVSVSVVLQLKRQIIIH